jgi:acylphosphatase
MAVMADVEPARRRVTVRGDVQGVFFRDSTRERANAAGLAGWVRNCRDGSVEAVFEGSAAAVEELVEFCRAGPARARVEDVEVREEPPEGLRGFSVR